MTIHTPQPPKSRINRLRQSFQYLAVVVIGLWLAGCVNLETHVTIYQDEQWETRLVMTVPQSTLDMVGGEANFEKELELPPDGQTVVRDGVELTWEKERLDDGQVVYRITSEGQGFNRLNQIAFDGNADIFLDAQDQINIRYWPHAELIAYTLTMTGGKIISSNADRIEGSTAVWNNPVGEIEVTMTGAGNIANLATLGGIAGGACLCLGLLAVAAGGGFYLYRRQSRPQYY